MRSYLLVAAAAVAIAAPAAARDNTAYVGIEGGPMWVENTDFDFEDDDNDLANAFIVEHDTGIDLDLIGGYDFGGFRTELEFGYKQAGVDELGVGNAFAGGGDFEADGTAKVYSGMLNVLLDIGDGDSWSGYVGPGIGIARVDYDMEADGIVDGEGFALDGQDYALAMQVIAGVRAPISSNIDLGLKYRYFNTSKLSYSETDGGGVANPPFDLEGRWSSHSLLASLIYNFASPPPPPPPPPPMPPMPPMPEPIRTPVAI